jgi:hypothetical protein
MRKLKCHGALAEQNQRSPFLAADARRGGFTEKRLRSPRIYPWGGKGVF